MLWVGTALTACALFFMPGLLEQFETPKIEVVRACGLGALAALIAGGAWRRARWRPLDIVVVAWLAVEVLTTALSEAPRVSLLGEARQHEGLLTSLALAGLYFAAREAFARPGRVRAALDLTLGLAAAVSLYTLAQATGHDPLQWRREAVYAGGYARPFATLGHPNLLGVFSAAAASAALALALAGPRGLRRGFAALVAALAVLATVLTLSRAAWLGAAFGLALAALLALRERGRAALPARAMGIAAGALTVIAIIATVAGRGVIGARLGELFSGGGSGASRLEIWRAAVAAWRARPLTGHGPDLFEMVFPLYQTPAYWRLEWSGLPVHAHSIYLHTLATRGLVGLVAGIGWAVALAAAAHGAWRVRADAGSPGLVPAAVSLLVSIAIAGAFGALGITGALLVVVASAMLATATAAAGPAPAPPAGDGAAKDRARAARGKGRPAARPVDGERWAARIVGATVALAALVWGFTGLRASRAASAAQAWMTSDPPRAVQASAYALSLAPHDDRLWRMHAETLLWLSTVTPAPAEPLRDAEVAARRAVALAPRRAENHLILARALGAREAQGDTMARAGTEAEFERSVTLAPMDGLSLMEYADHEVIAGWPARALPVARRVASLYPDEGATLAVLARALAASGERDSAVTTVERALRKSWHDVSERPDAERLLETLRAARPLKR